MILKEFRYIIAIAEEKSITRASQKLYISQSALSQFLADYEEQLGFPVFLRVPQGVTVTRDGAKIVEEARRCVEVFDRLISSARDKGTGQKRSIRFGIAEQRASVISPMLLSRFSAREPDIDLAIIEGNGSELREMVREGRLDLALCAALKAGEFMGNGLKVQKIQSEEFMLAIPRTHHLSEKIREDRATGRRWVSLKMLRNENYVMINEKRTMRRFIDSLLEKNDINVNILQTSTNLSTILPLSRNLNALAFIPKGMIGDRKDMNYVSLGKRGQYWTLQIVMPESAELSKEELSLVQVLTECTSLVCR